MSNVAFLFPGQGAQYLGMGKNLVESHPTAKRLYGHANEILGFDLLDICLNGPEERLHATDISQPAIFVASIAALEVLKESEPDLLPQVTATAGLSLGEYTALVFAGALQFADALRVVQERGRAMQAAANATPSGMVSALIIDLPNLQEVVQEASSAGRIWIANYLCPGNTVLSGEHAALDAACELISARGGSPKKLSVAGAFHTELMKPADDQLAQALLNVTISAPTVPVWSNVDARTHSDPNEIRDLLVRQVLQPVQWEQSMRAMLDAGVERCVEIGPGKVLAGLLKRINRKIECRSCPA